MMSTDRHSAPFRVFIVAGEPSGDLLAARLMAALKELHEDVEFSGVGGPLMTAQGLPSLFPMDDLTVMGVAEVVPKLPLLLKRISQTAAAARNIKPDVFITVDAPDFSFRVAKKLAGVAFKKIHYVAPSVWAWRPGRARKIAALYDHLLTLLPFEPPYFEAEGLAATFIGHSIIESGAADGNAARFREKYKIAPEDPLLMILPGSRRGEVTRHMDVFRQTAEAVSQKVSGLRIAIPVIGKTAPLVAEAIRGWLMPVTIIEDAGDKYDAMAAADVALAASGTVGLELALAKLPSVIAYRMHPLTAIIARKFVKLKYVNLINILQDAEIVPEYLLEDCTVDNLAPAVSELFHDGEMRDAQLSGYEQAMSDLGYGGDAPGMRAAKVVMEVAVKS